MAKKTRSGTPATKALDAAGIAYALHPYDHDPRAVADGGSYGLEAADALGVDPGRVFKTLVALLDGHELDLKALARALGGSRAAMAPVPDAERATGYVAGGISPVGQKRRLRTVVDESALEHDTVLVSAGRRGLDLETAPDDLVAITGAIAGRVGRS